MKTVRIQTDNLRSLLHGIRAVGLSLALFALLPICAQAQSTVNASGGSGTIAGNLYAYSIGEMVLVSTATSAQINVTQGLLQADGELTVGLREDTLVAGQMTLYPNPVDNILYLQPELAQGGELTMQLYDMNGRLIVDQEVRLSSGTERQEIQMASLAEGSYFLRTALRQGEQTTHKAFKIIKAGGKQ
ncbi:MAG: T9SS type A sorting domain-containing protein [Flavobacteriales bacterium]